MADVKMIIGECKHPRTYPFHNTTNGEKGSYCHDCGVKLPADASPSEPQDSLAHPDASLAANGAGGLRFDLQKTVEIVAASGAVKALHGASYRAAPTAAGSEEPKLKDDPLGIEFARRVVGAHTKLMQDLISSAAPVKPKRWSGLVSLVTAAGDSETNVTLEAPVASLAPAPTVHRVKVAPDAQMAFPSGEMCWQARYGQHHDYGVAESLESYRYLVLECKKEEAWRRILCIRQAMKAEANHE
jgi:hypothetical protein